MLFATKAPGPLRATAQLATGMTLARPKTGPSRAARRVYADHIRAGQHDPIPERPVTGLEQGPEPSSAAIAADAGEPGMGLGEPRSRDEYADTAARAAAFDQQIEAVATADHDAPGARQYGTAADNAKRECHSPGHCWAQRGMPGHLVIRRPTRCCQRPGKPRAGQRHRSGERAGGATGGRSGGQRAARKPR